MLHTLVPRAQAFSYYDGDNECVWNSDGAEDYEIDSLVAQLPNEAIDNLLDKDEPLHRTLSSGRVALALPVPGKDGGTVGLLVVLFSKNEGKSTSFNPSLLKSILEPAIEMIAENLRIAGDMRAFEQDAVEVKNELEFLYEIDEKILRVSRRHSSLAQLVGRSGRYLGINYSVLLIPSKRIRISATHSSWKKVNRKVLDRYLVEQLMPMLVGHRKPVIFEIPADDSPDSAKSGYQALLCPLLDNQGNVEGVLAQLGRVDQRKFSENERRLMSHIGRKVEYVIEQSYDSMTGLMNRAGFEMQLRESHDALKSADDVHQIIYFDLDNLQLVNDNFGRAAGDEVIMRFAQLLKEQLPRNAVFSRLTADDFCMLLTHANTDAALDHANKIRAQTPSLRYLQGDKSLQVTMSIGIADFTRSNGDEINVLTPARIACEAAKEHGGDRIEVYDEENQSAVRRFDDMQLVAEIQQALGNNEFELLAQPITSLSGASASPSFEVLLRMHDGQGGRVETGALISAAERYQLMPQIDRWVVSRAIAKLAEVQDHIAAQGAVFAINLSGQSLGDDDFLEFVEREIERSGLPDASLSFEITESAAVSNMEKAQAFIERLADRGCHISLDDFGAGLSSFAYLKDFRVDSLKIDGGFISDITDNRISESMVTAITQVAKVMGLKTIAEYVGSEEARVLLEKIGVDFAQGHLIGKPVPLEDVLSDLPDT